MLSSSMVLPLCLVSWLARMLPRPAVPCRSWLKRHRHGHSSSWQITLHMPCRPTALSKQFASSRPSCSVPWPSVRRFFVHHITNNVVKNFSANVTLATGASPVMSECAGEFSDFSQISPHAALLINTGMPFSNDPEDGGADIYLGAINEYNKRGLPVTLDPVGVGACKTAEGAHQDAARVGLFQCG